MQRNQKEDNLGKPFGKKRQTRTIKYAHCVTENKTDVNFVYANMNKVT